jgi:V/A-type H+-transporting ATPase subunit K
MSTAIILAYLGVAMMVGLAGLASAIGTSICGMTAVGAMKKDSSKFGSYMILSALPGSQGLYGFVAYFMIQGFLSPEITLTQGAAIFAGGIIMGIVGIVSAYFQSRVCAAGIAAIGNGHDVMTRTLILGAFPELYAILGLATIFLISLAI